jgi:hypothetical protein
MMSSSVIRAHVMGGLGGLVAELRMAVDATHLRLDPFTGSNVST